MGTMMPSFLDAALQYHDRGWCVIPIRHRDESGKQPTVPWKALQEHRPTTGELRKWFAARNLDGVAVILGRASGGLYCRDFDVASDYHAWAASQPELAARLPTVRTARGFHVYSVGEAVPSRKVERGELRSDGLYCLLPPSVHPSGVRYERLVPLPDGELPCVDPKTCGLLGVVAGIDRERECRPRCLSVSNSQPLGVSMSQSLPVSVIDILVQRAVELSLPDAEGKRNRMLFAFVRLLKAIPELADVSATQLSPIVREWHRRALPRIATKEFDITMADFVRAWTSVRYGADDNPLEIAKQRARDEAMPACAMQFENDCTRLLVALCAQLQALQGDAPFFLSYRDAGEFIGRSHQEAGSLLALLIATGVLKKTKSGNRRFAARYRFTGDGGNDEPETETND